MAAGDAEARPRNLQPRARNAVIVDCIAKRHIRESARAEVAGDGEPGHQGFACVDDPADCLVRVGDGKSVVSGVGRVPGQVGMHVGKSRQDRLAGEVDAGGRGGHAAVRRDIDDPVTLDLDHRVTDTFSVYRID